MRDGNLSRAILRYIFRDEPIVKRREGSQAKVPCRCRQRSLSIPWKKLACLTERLTSSRIFRGNIEPGKKRSHIGSTQGKQRKRNRMTCSELDRLVSQPGQCIQQNLRVFKDGAKRVATVSTQDGEPDIDCNQAGTQLQKEALLFFG